MWKPVVTTEYTKRHKHFEKKHPAELKAVLDNLDTYYKALSAGAKPQQIQFNFARHKEPSGARAIDQGSTKGKLRQTRLYIYADSGTETLHLITLGDKNNQRNGDIRTCEQFMKTLRQQKEKEEGEALGGS